MPKIPPQDRSTDSLHVKQRAAVLAFITAAKKKGFTVAIGETRRTRERQAYLYRQNSPKRWVTNCDGTNNLSMHQYGIATDLLLLDSSGRAIWDQRKWRLLYAQVPPKDYGLELIPQELLHVQLAGSQAQVMPNGKLKPAYIKQLGLTLT